MRCSVGRAPKDQKYLGVAGILVIALLIVTLILIVAGVKDLAGLPVLSAGRLAAGYLGAGDFSIGVFSLGIFSVGVFATGVFSIGIFSIGIFSIGVFSIGVVNLGLYSLGICALGRYTISMLSDAKKREPNIEKASYDRRSPGLFILSIFIVFLGIDIFVGLTLSELASYSVLALIAGVLITKKHWWREIGFTSSMANRRSLLLFVPAFLPVLWFLAIAPSMGYGTLTIPATGTLLPYFGFTLLIGFVEETYFRGIMLRALKPKRLWTSATASAILFGAVHFDNVLFGFSVPYTIMQVGYAFALGLAFAALVLVTGVIWPVVLAHGLIDFGASLNTATVAGATSFSSADYAITIFIIAIFIPYAFVLLRRSNSKQVGST